MSDLFDKLAAPFPGNEIEWRVGSTTKDKTKGLALAYLTSRHVQDRLDTVIGAENWQDRYEFHGTRTVCYLSLRINGEWITKADAAGDSEVEAEKGAVSDALKRAAVKWGIGRYLYELNDYWVDIEPFGRSYRIKKDAMDKLGKLLSRDVEGAPISRKGETESDEPEISLEDQIFAKLVEKVNAVKTMPALLELWKDVNTQASLKSLPPEKYNSVVREKDNRKNFLSQRPVDDDFPGDRRVA